MVQQECKRKRVALALVLSAILLFHSTFVLRETQAADKHLTFGKGRVSSVITGSVVRGERDKIRFRARPGQHLALAIASLENNAIFDVYRHVAGAWREMVSKQRSWDGKLPRSGANQYLIQVGGTRGNTSYELFVGVAPADIVEGLQNRRANDQSGSRLDATKYPIRSPIGDPFAEWQLLIQKGCNPRFSNPIVLRILRQVPYAMRRQPLEAKELTTFFALIPDQNKTFDRTALSAKELACVKRLKKREVERRKQWKICSAEVEKVFTTHPATFGSPFLGDGGTECGFDEKGEAFYGYASCGPGEEPGHEHCSYERITCACNPMEGCHYSAGG